MMRLICAVVAALVLAGCGTSETISANPNPLPAVVAALPASQQDQLKQDLTDVAANFDAAASIGLPTGDYAACAHLVNQQLGVETSAGAPTFPVVTLRSDGIFSKGSELLIDALRLEQLQKSGITVPGNCVLALGVLNLRALSQILKGVPGGLPINVTPFVPSAALVGMVAAPVKAAP